MERRLRPIASGFRWQWRRGHTRSHSEHGSEARQRRWYLGADPWESRSSPGFLRRPRRASDPRRRGSFRWPLRSASPGIGDHDDRATARLAAVGRAAGQAAAAPSGGSSRSSGGRSRRSAWLGIARGQPGALKGAKGGDQRDQAHAAAGEQTPRRTGRTPAGVGEFGPYAVDQRDEETRGEGQGQALRGRGPTSRPGGGALALRTVGGSAAPSATRSSRGTRPGQAVGPHPATLASVDADVTAGAGEARRPQRQPRWAP